MPRYQVFLHDDITTTIEVSPDGIIVSSEPHLQAAVGLRFEKFQNWVRHKHGEIFTLHNHPQPQPKANPKSG